MRTKLSKIAQVAALGLALALTLSCSSGDGGDNPGSNSGAFTDDRDGQFYKWVKIGKQTWMAENLNYAAEGSKCGSDYKPHCEIYGRLYNWVTAMDISPEYESALYSAPAKHKGVCPAKWHIPSDAEWDALMLFLDPNCTSGDCWNGGKLLKATSGWNSYNGQSGGTDAYGFSALPGGYGYSVDGGFFYGFEYVGYRGYWWSASEVNSDDAYYRHIYYDSEQAFSFDNDKSYLYSVRCLQD
jgi:uncharacterized protein (TIGR02145 family)